MGWSVGGVNDATAVLLDHGEYDGLMFLRSRTVRASSAPSMRC